MIGEMKLTIATNLFPTHTSSAAIIRQTPDLTYKPYDDYVHDWMEIEASYHRDRVNCADIDGHQRL
jgi:hypothetical protein